MPLCDTLLRCAEEPSLYRPLWSEEILEETSRTLQKFGYPLSQVERRIWAMKDAFQDACVRIASDPLKRVPLLPDSKDKHVVAAAMHSGAQGIVTFNLRHFPTSLLAPLGLKVFSPDEFLVGMFGSNPQRIMDVLDAQAKKVRQQRGDVIARFLPGMPRFVELVRGQVG